VEEAYSYSDNKNQANHLCRLVYKKNLILFHILSALSYRCSPSLGDAQLIFSTRYDILTSVRGGKKTQKAQKIEIEMNLMVSFYCIT
jgi:hypothetical protein